MKTLFDHLEYVKGKPHHVRKRIAFGVATAGTALVGMVWLVSSLSAGAFAITGSSFAESVGQGSVVTTGSDTGGGSQNVAGAIAGQVAAVSQGLFGQGESALAGQAPARIEIVNVASSSPAPRQSEQTTIPF